MRVERFPDNPIITPSMKARRGGSIGSRIGSNINGPSLIRAPEWLPGRLGEYYLYFAHHQGRFIRLAYADRLEGPWEIFEPGTLQLADSFCRDHVASPDVHVDDQARQVRMYYHGPTGPARQETRVAVSSDGIHFECHEEILGYPYFRVFRRDGWWYALGMPGRFYRSADGLTGFEAGPVLFSPDMRHSALKLDGDTLSVFHSNVGDAPESILVATIDLTPNWLEWRESAATVVLAPETDYEGVALPKEPSVRGWAPERVRQLRDPAVFREDGRAYLVYSVAGESGLAIGRLLD